MANSVRNMKCFKDLYKVTSVKNTIVLNIDKPHKDGPNEVKVYIVYI
jgi:hypothetical protein